MKKFLVLLAIIIIIAIAYFVVLKTDQSKMTTEKLDQPLTLTEEKIPGYSGAKIAGQLSLFLDFQKSDYDAALVTDKLIVLYFYANWCPICKEETANALYPAFNELTTDQIIGFQVSYNDDQTDANEKALAREFGVAYQHTKVFLKNGQRILKSPESWDKNRYLAEFNKFLNQ